MMKSERILREILTIIDLYNLHGRYGVEYSTIERGLKEALKLVGKYTDGEIEPLAWRIILTSNFLLVWIYTEEDYGVALNPIYPDLSEWGYLPKYNEIPQIAIANASP